jgi:pyruvate kinase
MLCGYREVDVRKTKLVITMGPALAEEELLREALKIADAVRLNASHGDLATRLETLKRIRVIADALQRRIPVFLDLQGPKWRVGALAEPVNLEEGSIGAFIMPEDPMPQGYPWVVPLPHPELFKGAASGQEWSLDDGNLLVRVKEALPRLVLAEVKTGGLLKARKGVHPIGLDVAMEPLTPKDLVDIRWGVENEVDLFAQSFVRRAADVQALAATIRAFGGSQPIIAKIEHPAALKNLDEILDACWGVMVARGDLGVELGVERVPAIQKQIIRSARQSLKPVITATQMLESMIENASPTRAEASDVANAIWDGTDAVMLSAESAAGKHPLEAIRWLAKIAEDADDNMKPQTRRFGDHLSERFQGHTEVAVAFAACRAAEELKARYLLVFTEGGGSARLVSRLAGDVPVLGATPGETNARRMGLLRGVESLIVPRVTHLSEMLAALMPRLKTEYGLHTGDRVVMTMGHPLGTTGTTNTMRVVAF